MGEGGGKHSVPLVMLGAGLYFRPHRVFITCIHCVLRVTNAVSDPGTKLWQSTMLMYTQ